MCSIREIRGGLLKLPRLIYTPIENPVESDMLKKSFAFIRNIQDREANKGWRIARINPAPEGMPDIFVGHPAVLLLALLFAIAFAAFIVRLNWFFFGVTLLLFIIPLLVGTCHSFYLFFKGRLTKWVKIEAYCYDIDIRQMTNYIRGRPRSGWSYRILCEFDFNGKRYQATPEGYDGARWRLFASQQEVSSFLEATVRKEERFPLLINMHKPLQCKLK